MHLFNYLAITWDLLEEKSRGEGGGSGIAEMSNMRKAHPLSIRR